MRLTEEQLRFFDTFGFLKFPGLFAPEADKIIERFEKIWSDHGGGLCGKPHDYKRRSDLIQFIERDEYLSSLIDDPRLDEMLSSLLGDDYNYAGSDGNYYVGDTRWHSDHGGMFKQFNAGGKYTSVKLALYLDPVTRDTGCLRVIPGSHREGDIYADALQEMVRVSGGTHDRSPSEELWGIAGSEVPAVALETYPGDVAMFNHKTKHSSWGGSDRRRMFTINYEHRYDEDDLDALRVKMAQLTTQKGVERIYEDTIVNTAGPGRMRHLEQRLANDGHMQEMARKARSDMEEPSSR